MKLLLIHHGAQTLSLSDQTATSYYVFIEINQINTQSRERRQEYKAATTVFFPQRLVVVLARIASSLGGVAEIISIVIVVGIVGSVIIVWRSISVPIITTAVQKLHISVNANV